MTNKKKVKKNGDHGLPAGEYKVAIVDKEVIEHIGKCPICSSLLYEYKHDVFPDEKFFACTLNSHFIINQDVFNTAWKLFEAGNRSCKSAEALLKLLLQRNISTNNI